MRDLTSNVGTVDCRVKRIKRFDNSVKDFYNVETTEKIETNPSRIRTQDNHTCSRVLPLKVARHIRMPPLRGASVPPLEVARHSIMLTSRDRKGVSYGSNFESQVMSFKQIWFENSNSQKEMITYEYDGWGGRGGGHSGHGNRGHGFGLEKEGGGRKKRRKACVPIESNVYNCTTKEVMVRYLFVRGIKLSNFAFDFEIIEGEKMLNDTKEVLLMLIYASISFLLLARSGKDFVEEWKRSEKLLLSVELAEPAKERVANTMKTTRESHKDPEDTATTMEVATIEN
ncbi:hypothetical protein PVK06_042366 [Gossypium arboreum]|uniref:Uncharacterized protein n=1 Tax=Gossypium arboreum TaxID=29729 RepID=A0ABR0MKG5_GOSAR|nr:hypothetical protein PVK06_042366 [Gossypium arboreum]